MLMLQREEVIDSASVVSDDNDFGVEKAMDDLRNVDPMVRMFAMGRLKRALANYQTDPKVDPFD